MIRASPAPRPRHDILILGAGPAGCVAARGLRRSGYEVALIGAPRTYPAIEGLTERAVECLAGAGCRQALRRMGPEVRRIATWNGVTSDANREYLVDRRVFDEGLRLDAAEAGAMVIYGRVRRIEQTADGWRVTARGDGEVPVRFDGSFLVEARGRAAPAGSRGNLRGPATTALARRWCVPPDSEARTAVASFADGWSWFVAPGNGSALLQVFVSSRSGELPPRRELEPLYDDLARRIPEASQWLSGAVPNGAVRARNAGPLLAGTLLGPRYARVGDAAFAVDPLSGNGMFQAVALALGLPAVVNTLIKRPRDRATAEAFYRERIEGTFFRMARVGRDFYQCEERWSELDFWRARRAWPDERPSHVPPGGGPTFVAERPVSENGFIVLRPVIVTPDYPRGIWRVRDVPLLPLLRFVADSAEQGFEATTAAFGESSGHPPDAVATALSWLADRRLVVVKGAQLRLPASGAALLRGHDGAAAPRRSGP